MKALLLSIKWIAYAILMVGTAAIGFREWIVREASAVFDPKIQALEQRHSDAISRLESIDRKLDILIERK